MGLFNSLFQKEVQPLDWYLDTKNNSLIFTWDLIEAAKECFSVDWDCYENMLVVKDTEKIGNLVYLEDANLPKCYKKEKITAEELLKKACEKGDEKAAFFLGLLYEHGVYDNSDENRYEVAEKYYTMAREKKLPEMIAFDYSREHLAKIPNCSWCPYEQEAISMHLYVTKNELYQKISDILPKDKLENFVFISSLIICHYASKKNYPLSRTMVTSYLANYEKEKFPIKKGQFYDFFKYNLFLRSQERIMKLIEILWNEHTQGSVYCTNSLVAFDFLKTQGGFGTYCVEIEERPTEKEQLVKKETNTFSYSSYYYEYSDESKEWQMWNNCGSYAVLKNSESGDTITVHPHKDRVVCDDSGNLYYPK